MMLKAKKVGLIREFTKIWSETNAEPNCMNRPHFHNLIFNYFLKKNSFGMNTSTILQFCPELLFLLIREASA